MVTIATFTSSETPRWRQRKVQTKSVIMLILFCSHPEPGTAQSQKSQIWRIPVSPLFNAGDSAIQNESIVQPDSSRSRAFDELMDPLQSDEIGVSERRLSDENIQKSVTTGDLLARVGLLGSGKESGRWGGGRLSLRGHPGDEPAVSLGGVLLSSGFSGAHSEELIPPIAVQRLRVYPFFPSLNLPQVGVSGGYDIELIQDKQPAAHEAAVRFEFPLALHLANRSQIACTEASCLQFSWAGSFYRGATEVVDDRNTPQDSSDDTNESIKFRDLSRISAAASYFADHGNGTRWDSTFLAGAESRSTSGLPLSSISEFNRLKRRLLFMSQRISHLSPGDGWKAMLRLGVRQESALYQQDLMNNSMQIRDDERDEDFLSVQTNLSLPFVGSGKNHLFLLNTSIEASSFKSEVGLGGQKGNSVATDSTFENSKTEGLLYSLSMATGVRMELGAADSLKTMVNLYSNRFSLERVCGVFSPQVLCTDKENASSRNSVGGQIEWRRPVGDSAMIYAQGGQLQRLPRPIEIAGRPDGVVANPELSGESTRAAELGLESRWGTLSVFYARDTDLISAEQVSPFLLRYENTAVVQRVGVGSDSKVRIVGIDFAASAEWIRSTIVKGRPGQRVLPFVAESRWSTSLEKTIAITPSAGFWSGNLNSEVRYEESGPYWLDFQGVSRLKPPGIVALAVGTPLAMADGRLETRLEIRNLFDKPASRLSLIGQSDRNVPWSLSPVLPIERRTIELGFRLLTR